MPANARLWGWSADPPPGWPKLREDEGEEARRGEEGRGCPLWARVANAAGSDGAFFGHRTGDPGGGREMEMEIDAGVLERALGDGSVVMRPGKTAGGEVAIAMWNRKNCGGEATSASASASASASVSRR